MPYTEQQLNNQIKMLDDDQSLLDMLLEFEGVLDSLNLYAYRNWDQGEVIEGPMVSRHFISVDLLYWAECMPDPEGAKRLLKRGIPVKFTRDNIKCKVPEPKTTAGINQQVDRHGHGAYGTQGVVAIKNQFENRDCWIVTIQMPRKYLDSNVQDFIEIGEDEFVDGDSFNDAAVQSAQQSMDPTAGVDPVNTDDTMAGEI